MIKKISTIKMLVASMMVLVVTSINAQCPTAPLVITQPAGVLTASNSTSAFCGSPFATNYVDSGGAAGNYANSQN